MKEIFRQFSERAAQAVGSYWAFLAACTVVGIWIVTGPAFEYSDTWQLIINTGTTIITFLMVFLIQNTQNRESRIMSLKLDELLRSSKDARTALVELDSMSDDDLEHVRLEFQRLREKYAPLVDDDLAHVSNELDARKGRRSKGKGHAGDCR